MRKVLTSLAMLFVFATITLAGEAEIVSYDAKKKVVTFKMAKDTKDRTVELVKGHPHVHAVDGKLLKGKEIEDALKKGVRVNIDEDKNGEIHEIEILADKK